MERAPKSVYQQERRSKKSAVTQGVTHSRDLRGGKTAEVERCEGVQLKEMRESVQEKMLKKSCVETSDLRERRRASSQPNIKKEGH